MTVTDPIGIKMAKGTLGRFETERREVPREIGLIYQELRSSEDKRALCIDNSCTNSILSLILGRNKLLRGKTWFIWGDDNNKAMHNLYPLFVDSQVVREQLLGLDLSNV